MKCPECGEEVFGQYAHFLVTPENTWNWKCRKKEPTLIDPTELKRLIEAAETNGATISNMLYAMKDYCFHDDQSALRRLAGGEE